jgi:hypothetical protein
MSDRIRHYAEHYPLLYRNWFESLYKDKYYYMGDAELMSAALLLDVGMYYIGLVGPAYRNPERAFLDLPFGGRIGRMVAATLRFYNRRLAALGKRRWAAGYYGRHNNGWRELYDGFVPDFRLRKLIQKGLLRWWRAEITNLRLAMTSGAPLPASNESPATSAEACKI